MSVYSFFLISGTGLHPLLGKVQFRITGDQYHLDTTVSASFSSAIPWATGKNSLTVVPLLSSLSMVT